jgi:hypothetical protein
MIEPLAEKKCAPCRGGGPPLTQAEAERFQSQTPNWDLRMTATASNGPSASAIFGKRSTLFATSATWLKPKGTTLMSASAGVTRPSRCPPRRSRDCTRTILSWRASLIRCSMGWSALPIVNEVETLESWQLRRRKAKRETRKAARVPLSAAETA